MIIFSCYIYTNNILYTVEIYNPHVPDQWHIIPHTSSVPSSMFQLIPKSRTNRSGRVKTPGQYYIIWIIKYRSSFKPTSKGRNEWKNKTTNICTSLEPRSHLKNNSDKVFIQRRLIVSEAAATSAAAAAAAAASSHSGGGGRGSRKGHRGQKSAAGTQVEGRAEVSTVELQC